MQRSTSFGIGLTLWFLGLAVFYWIHSIDPGDNTWSRRQHRWCHAFWLHPDLPWRNSDRSRHMASNFHLIVLGISRRI